MFNVGNYKDEVSYDCKVTIIDGSGELVESASTPCNPTENGISEWN